MTEATNTITRYYPASCFSEFISASGPCQIISEYAEPTLIDIFGESMMMIEKDNKEKRKMANYVIRNVKREREKQGKNYNLLVNSTISQPTHDNYNDPVRGFFEIALWKAFFYVQTLGLSKRIPKNYIYFHDYPLQSKYVAVFLCADDFICAANALNPTTHRYLQQKQEKLTFRLKEIEHIERDKHKETFEYGQYRFKLPDDLLNDLDDLTEMPPLEKVPSV